MPTTLIRRKWLARRLFGLVKKFAPSMAGFVYSAIKEDQKAIFYELRGYYPKTAKFCPLTVDFDFMNAGDAKKPYLQQLKDVSLLKKKFENKQLDVFLPFVCADPRRKNVF